MSVTERNCKYSPNGVDFLGYINRTRSGKVCLNWYDFDDISLPYESKLDGDNYCRMASSASMQEERFNHPWCYTVEGPELCDIPYCGECNRPARRDGYRYSSGWVLHTRIQAFACNKSHFRSWYASHVDCTHLQFPLFLSKTASLDSQIVILRNGEVLPCSMMYGSH